MRKIDCAICKSKQKKRIIYKKNFSKDEINESTFSARRIPDSIHYEIAKCEKCGLFFATSILDEEQLNHLYNGSDFNYKEESEHLKKTYYRYFKKYILRSDKKIKVLDVGCGNGFFLEELKENGIKNFSGIEPGKKSITKAKKSIRQKIKQDILRKGLFNENSFDAICCFHTLDHVPDPNSFLRTTYGLLKKGGKALFIVHNTDGLSVKIFGEKSPIFDIEHVFLFNPRSLSQIFVKNNFKEVEVFNIKNTYPFNYWLKLFPMPGIIKKVLIKNFEVLGFGSKSISLSPGNIGVIATKN